ncbi:nitrite reductase small subunit NirD [Nissabacter archeti]|uniref:Nitrite reductase small subunit NirD n=1 Tax=Nissabacter archeti TaxID=1917880 RepID=A0ABS5JBQ0_9GAMM|nr:nitrite reductase large subunit NirB [Nissabacter archeti]MBS0967385.1 nitrite reductase small subunit NirD [Nissabacter archeti]
MTQRLIVVGNGMAGMHCVETLCRLAPGRFAVSVIGAEPHGSYNRILLSPVLAGEQRPEETLLPLPDSAMSDNVTFYHGETALRIDRARRVLHTGQRSLPYDQLVLATGTRPLLPQVPGVELDGVLGFRTLADVERMLARCRPGAPAVVLGGGILGIEAACALAQRGMRVTLLHRHAGLMERQLDNQAGQLLKADLHRRGLRILTGCEVAAFHGHGTLEAVTLGDGTRLPAVLAVACIGTRPETSLAAAAGLACDRGILVDGRLATADPAISAVGECAQPGTFTAGLVAPCREQAEVLAQRLAGQPGAAWQPSPLPTRLKVTGIAAFSAGEVQAAPQDEIHHTFDPLSGHYRRLLLRNGCLRGVMFYGDTTDAAAYSHLLGQPVSDDLLLGLHSEQSGAAAAAPRRSTTMSDALFSGVRPVLLLAGHGMVGHYFLEQLVERNLHRRYQIIVCAEEPVAAYDRVHLSEFFGGRSAASLSLVADGFFDRHGIELRLGCTLTAIDRVRRCVVDNAGRETPYDHLVLATGSAPFVPPIPGADRPHCLVYRTLSDLEAIAASAGGAARGVVIGGGLLGLEAAHALKQLGLETHVVEFAPRLMAVQLDDGGAAMLRRKIDALGVTVHTGHETKSITDGSSARHCLTFADGSTLESDLVLFSAGIRPRDALARESDLAVGPRGGIVIDNQCRTSDPAIFALGECALWDGRIFGLVAPGYQMARTLAATLAGEAAAFTGADMSTKLKLLGVEVASLGDAHGSTPGSQSYRWEDGPSEVYKKIVVSADGKRLLGAVLVGDSSDYPTLHQMMLNDLPLPAQPAGLILPAAAGAAPALGVAALPDSAQVCSCHNVSKGAILAAVDGGCTDMAGIKACTKAATGCGGCAALVKQVMEAGLAAHGVEVKRDICEHFAYSRQELYLLIRAGKIRTFGELLAKHGRGHGCEICKPLAGSLLASCWNDYLLEPAHRPLQDTNDRYFANIQKDGTYSVVPRIPAGEITPDGLLAIGAVAKTFNLYTKITGGQRVDLFGARLEQLPAIWQRLVDAGFETGHAYGKSLRTVKSCVGSTWCRYGVQDSTGLAIELEHRYKGLRSPHKIKMAVSGCTRECAEAQSKDVGVIATDKGWNLYVCGNGGMKPRHAELLAADLDRETLIRTIDRFLMFYIRTADRLQRTSVWRDNLEGGLETLRDVVLHDSLGLGAELEQEMQAVVESYQCEWQTTLASPEQQALFRPFLNSDQPDEAVVQVLERGQPRPAGLPPVMAHAQPGDGWEEVGLLSAIPADSGLAARLGDRQIALFHLPHTAEKVFALENHEPGSQANVLARGLTGDAGGEPIVISPLYKQRFRLRDGTSLDKPGVRLLCWPVRVEQGRIWVCRQPVTENALETVS